MSLNQLSSPEAAQAAQAAVLETFQSSVGAWFIGAIASVGLLGVVSLQSWTYFLRFPEDRQILKVLVSYLVLAVSYVT
jgi:hypothetical protein